MKQRPRLNKDKEKIYPHYGNMSMTCREALRIKTTHICSVEGCDYTSRGFAMYSSNKLSQVNSVSSRTCPTHGGILLDVGMVMRIPKKGNKRVKFLNELRNAPIIHIRNKKNKS